MRGRSFKLAQPAFIALIVTMLLLSTLLFIPETVKAPLPSVVEDTVGYGGFVDYASQVFMNTNGDLVAIYGRGEASSQDRMMVRYSTDDGYTWSSRIVLFSTSAQGDGIIDDDVASQWEYDGRIFDDTLYIVFHVKYPDYAPVQRTAFTKIDISDVSNIATYSNWKSANGTSPPSEGNGDDGQGYDVLGNYQGDGDPCIEILSDRRIVVTYSTVTSGGEVNITVWDDSWSAPVRIMEGSAGYLVHNLAVDEFDNLHFAGTIVAGDGNDCVIYKWLESGDDILTASNWRNATGDTPSDTYDSFDIIIDVGVVAVGFPHMTVSNDNIVLVTTGTEPNPWKDMYYNWSPNDGTGWNESTTENSAGIEVETGTLDMHSTSIRRHGIVADGNNNIYAIYQERTTKEIRYIKWDPGTEAFGSYTLIYDLPDTNNANIIAQKFTPGWSNTGMVLFDPYTLPTAIDLWYANFVVETNITGKAWWDKVPTVGNSRVTVEEPTEEGGGPGQWDRWAIGFSYKKHRITNEVRFHAIMIDQKEKQNASYYIWIFGDGATYKSYTPNITHTFRWGLYTIEDVKLTVVMKNGVVYRTKQAVTLDNTLIVALICMTVITFAAIAIQRTRRRRQREELIMVETEGR